MESIELSEGRRIVTSDRRLVYEGECFVRGDVYRRFSILKKHGFADFVFGACEDGYAVRRSMGMPIDLVRQGSDLSFVERNHASSTLAFGLVVPSASDVEEIACVVGRFLRREVP